MKGDKKGWRRNKRVVAQGGCNLTTETKKSVQSNDENKASIKISPKNVDKKGSESNLWP